MTFLDPSIQEIVSIIKSGVDVGELITRGLTHLTPEILDRAIRDWQDPIMVSQWLKLENPVVAFLAKSLFRSHWERVEFVLTDGDFLYSEIIKDNDKKKILDTPRGMAWLNYTRRRSYEYYFWYTWGKKCPRCSKDMDRIKTKCASNLTSEIYLCKCGYTIPIFDIASTHEHKIQNNEVMQLMPQLI